MRSDATFRDIREQAFPATLPIEEQLRFLLRYAILAPSARNSQPWRFVVEANVVLIHSDVSRWQVVADPDQRELDLSLGCALENLLVVAEHYGFRFSVTHSPEPFPGGPLAMVAFVPGGRRSTVRAALGPETILKRHTAHGRFARRQVAAEHRQALLGRAEGDDIVAIFSDDPAHRQAVADLYRRAADALLGRDEYRRELADVVGEGALGTPWPLSRLGAVAIASERTARRLTRMELAGIRHTPLFGLLASRDDSRASRIRSGQLLERVWLAATTCHLGVQPLSSILEVPETRTELETTLPMPVGYVAQELVRIGYPRHGSRDTPRHPVTEVVRQCGRW